MNTEQINKLEELLLDEKYSDIIPYIDSLNLKEKDSIAEMFKGLSYYDHPDKEESFYLKASKKHFEEALKIDPANQNAIIYLGYVSLDNFDYQEAYDYFFKFHIEKNIKRLYEIGQVWKAVNLLELMSVCQLRLENNEIFFLLYNIWVNQFNVHIKDEDFYFPKDLVNNVSYFLENHGDTITGKDKSKFINISSELIRIIKSGTGYEKLYNDEVKKLKNWHGTTTYKFVEID